MDTCSQSDRFLANLASKLPGGEFLDELSGICSMTDLELDTIVSLYFNDVRKLIDREWLLLKEVYSVSAASNAAEAAL